MRYIHMNGASMFFIVTYIHIFRGLYYGSYKEPRELLWMLGVVILLLMMATAFMGYVLPWGQMSYWGATVITNLFSAIPLVGNAIVTWLWGGFTVDNPTLNRFYSLHYLLPFVIVGVVVLHLVALHQHGSNNPLGIDRKGPQDSIPFHPYYTIKDLFGLCVFLIIYAGFVFFYPNLLGDPANYIPANPLPTPAEIVPEWYFLPFYAILRSVPTILFIPAKLAGVLTMFGAIGVLFILPWLDTSPVRSATFRPIYRWLFPLLIDRLHRARRRRRASAGRRLHHHRADRHRLLFRSTSSSWCRSSAGSSGRGRCRPASARRCSREGRACRPRQRRWRSRNAQDHPRPRRRRGTDRWEPPRLPTNRNCRTPHWSFEGPFGTYDRAELQRGFQVYAGGLLGLSPGEASLLPRTSREIGFSEEEVKAIAAAAKVTDGPNDAGEMFERPGRPSDPIVAAIRQRQRGARCE